MTGKLTRDQFLKGFQRIGIQINEREYRFLSDVLDPNNTQIFNYEPLLQEIDAVPNMLFINESIKKLADLVIYNDWTPQAFKEFAFKDATITMSYGAFSRGLQSLRA